MSGVNNGTFTLAADRSLEYGGGGLAGWLAFHTSACSKEFPRSIKACLKNLIKYSKYGCSL